MQKRKFKTHAKELIVKETCRRVNVKEITNKRFKILKSL
jgi:hypothetical protein